MSLKLAKQLVDFSKTLGVKNILLIGGEPTYYPHFFELVAYINEKGIKSTLVTNGYKFKDMDFVKKIEESGLSSIGFSIKAANQEQQKELTKIDAFADIKQAIKNLSTIKNVKVGYSTVVSKDTINNMEEFAQMIADLDNTKYLRYSTCNPMFEEKGSINKKYTPEPRDLVNAFVEKFAKISEILHGKASIEQNLATCLWPKDFIDKLKQTKQISFGCHLQSRKGLVFNKDGKVIPCNSLPSFPIGQYGVDFTNKEDFEKFWMSKELVNLYDKIYEYPATKCQSCGDYLECGGGCPLKWFAYNAKEIIG
jgi:radical SAM protein with 4Fe4S-binding SPASM domain